MKTLKFASEILNFSWCRFIQKALHFIIPFQEIASVQNRRHKFSKRFLKYIQAYVIVADCFAVSLSYHPANDLNEINNYLVFYQGSCEICQDTTNIGGWFQKAQFGLVDWSFSNKFPDLHPLVKPVKILADIHNSK